MIKIRKAAAGDEKKIVDISIKTWETTYGDIFSQNLFERRRNGRDKSELWWKEHLSTDHNAYVVLCGDEIVGFMDFFEKSRTLDDYTEIGSIYILKDYQNQGIGRKFFELAFDLTRKLGKQKLMLNVLENNPAINFYSKMGGQQAGEFEVEIDGKKCKEIVVIFNL